MKHKKIFKIKALLRQLKTEGISLRRRFVLYIISAIAMVLSLIILLFNLFGVIDLTNNKIMGIMDAQLSSYADNIEQDYNQTAAHAISFAEQLESSIQTYLIEHNLTFSQLENNPEALTDLQGELYDTVYLNLQIAPSSGTFYILNTTVNSHLENRLYNGIYLKYINLYSESTVNNEISLYRGSYATGKENNLFFHSGWQNEIETDFFETCDQVFTKGTHYVLSPATPIPATWERARYVYVPIHDLEENIIGVCGYEVNDLYFQLSKKSNDGHLGQLVCALLNEHQGIYSGQFNSNRYSTSDLDNLKVIQKDDTAIFDFGTEKCIGKTKTVHLGGDTFTVALMLTEDQYYKHIIEGRTKTAVIVILVALFSFVCCLVLSKKYVTPIITKIRQLQEDEEYGNQLKIREIDDLFAYLEEKDTQYDRQLKALEEAKQVAEEETIRTKEAYENAQKKYELAQQEIKTLANERKQEIVVEEYEYFISNLNNLTPTEKKVYELYLEGNTAKEILTILGIKENTLKYHNKNIYSKLGISSRKQLLRYAALKKQEDMT